MPRRILFPLFILLLTPELCIAQQSRWANLAEISPGQKLSVVDRHNQSVSGEFLRFSDTYIALRVNGREITIAREEVSRVTTKGQHRKRNVLIGLLVGAGVGAGLGGGMMERESGYGGAVAGTTVGFAAIGAGVGALIPGSKVVYRAEREKASTTETIEESQRPNPAN